MALILAVGCLGFVQAAGQLSARSQVADQQGDALCDGSINVVDALAILQYAVGMRSAESSCPLSDSATKMNESVSDVNDDGQISAVDALFIMQCVVGRFNTFCPEEVPATPTPALGCPSDTYEHEGICYPSPWTGEQQYGCFPTTDGAVICIDPASPTPLPTPDTATPIELSVLQEVEAEIVCIATQISVENNVYRLSCVGPPAHSDDIKIERFVDEAAAGAEFATRQEDATSENFRCYPAFKKEVQQTPALVTTYTWHVDSWLITIHSYHDTPHGSANSIGLSEKVYEAAVNNQMIGPCSA